MGNKPTKEQLLKRYSDKPVTKYFQIDTFFGGGGPVEADSDGDLIFTTKTHELMTCPDIVRILVGQDVTREQLIRSLSKVIKFMDVADYENMRDSHVDNRFKEYLESHGCIHDIIENLGGN